MLIVLLLAAQDWTTLHADNQRSGWVRESVGGPYERRWCRADLYYIEKLTNRTGFIR